MQPLQHSPGLPRDEQGPVFAAPWEAQAFAMTLGLYERGAFTWVEWADALAKQISAARQVGDSGHDYYLHWLAALEHLVTTKGLGSSAELARTQAAWANAAARTPHGQPISLGEQDFKD